MAMSGTALALAVDLATAHTDDHDARFFLGPTRGAVDEAAITEAWSPVGVAGWVEATGDVLLSNRAQIKVDAGGAELAVTIDETSRAVWSDDRAVAIIARHWFPSSARWGGWYLEGWGYLDGSARDNLGIDALATSERTVTYRGYWGRTRVPAHRLGQRNLAKGGQIVASSPALADPNAEAPLEYISQDDCAPTKLVDGAVDTVAVADAIADPVIPPIGETALPRFLRVRGPFTRGVAAGGVARFAEIWCGYSLTGWGRTWAGIPGMYQEGTPAVRAEAGFVSEVVTYPDGSKGFRVTTPQSYDPKASTWIQWIVGGPVRTPTRVSVEIKAGATPSIGKRVHLLMSDATGPHTQRQDVRPLVLGQDWQRFEFAFVSDAQYGGAKFEITTEQGEAVSGPVVYELRNLDVGVGYSDLQYDRLNGKKLFLCVDNGAGVSRAIRIAFDLSENSEDWSIPAYGSALFVDDAATFKREFGDTSGRAIFQTKAIAPEWFFAPGVGRMKLAYGNNPDRNNYDDPSLTTVDEIVFAVANGGVPWRADQALSRQNPIGTGYFAVENFPHVGLAPAGGNGGGYWWIKLADYAAPTLARGVSATSMRLPVDDPDKYTDHGLGTLQTERIWWAGKDGDELIVHQRGIDGTTAVAHDQGTPFVPDTFGGVYQNTGTRQTGNLVATIQLRRKPEVPIILAGVVLTSNLVAPGNPMEGGARLERHPDWTLAQRWHPEDRQGNLAIVTIPIPEGVREARHLFVYVEQMGRDRYGNPQRPKINEVVALEWSPASGAGGGWAGHSAATVGDALAHLLTQHAAVPTAKVRLVAPPAPLGELTIAPTMVDSALATLAESGRLRVRADRANGYAIEPDPTHPAYDPGPPVWTWDTSKTLGALPTTWGAARKVAQVRVTGRDPNALRTYSAVYPTLPGSVGAIVEVRDVLLRSAADAALIAQAEFRARNARRTLTIPAGALPWLAVGQRHTLNFPEMGGEYVGVGVIVVGYTITIGVDDGGVTWQTAVEVAEWAG